MNTAQFEALHPLLVVQAQSAPTSNALISVSELENPTQDRTLMYGYTFERETVHVYLKGGLIHKAVYAHPDKLVFSTSGESASCVSLVPEKRAYPAACDAQFAQLMLDKNQYVPYTTFVEREDIQFHGKLIEELVALPHTVTGSTYN